MEVRHCFDKLRMLSIRAFRSFLLTAITLFFHTVFETGRTEALVCLHVVQNLPAVFKPDGLLISVFVLLARRPHSGGKVVQQHHQLLRFDEAGRVCIPYFFHCPKTLAHWPDHLPSPAFG